jgi:hypothetical protein
LLFVYLILYAHSKILVEVEGGPKGESRIEDVKEDNVEKWIKCMYLSLMIDSYTGSAGFRKLSLGVDCC